MPPKIAQPHSKSFRRSKSDQKWDVHKEEIRQLYMKETLEDTMQIIEDLHGFKASTRKWKEKLDEWGFSKNLSADSMRVVVAKCEKRARDGKETVVLFGGFEVTEERMKNFKRRKTVNGITADGASPSAETPANVTYFTPRTEVTTPSEDYFEEKAVEDIHDCVSNEESTVPFEPFLPPSAETIAACKGLMHPSLWWEPIADDDEDKNEDGDEGDELTLRILSLNCFLSSSYALRQDSYYAEAKKECEAALAGCEAMGMEDKRLECQCLLGDILTNMDTREAEICLIEALADSLDRMQLHQIMSSVQSLLKMLPHTQSSKEVRLTFVRMLKIAARCLSFTAIPQEWPSELLFEVLALASSYSAKQSGEFDFAERLFVSIDSQISSNSSHFQGEEKVKAYMEMVLHYQRQEGWGRCAYYLRLIPETILKHKGNEHPLGKYLEMCVGRLDKQLWEVDSNRALPAIFAEQILWFQHVLEHFVPNESSSDHGKIEPVERNVGPTEVDTERGVQTAREVYPLDEWHTDIDAPWIAPASCQDLATERQIQRVQRPVHVFPDSISGQSSSFASSRSYRYGITYSEPSIAGISDSISQYLRIE